MAKAQDMDTVVVTAGTLDDCWNRIGIRGDKSCPKLTQFVHCRNCDVYAEAATRMLDRYQLYRQDDAATHETAALAAQPLREASESLLVFRLGEEWLALPTAALVEVSTVQAIHTLPHRRSPAVLGVSNVRGALVACLSLTVLLGLEEITAAPEARVLPRMLLLGDAAHATVVCPVDEVEGIHAVPLSLYGAAGHGKFSRALLQWQGRSVRLLEAAPLFDAITRNLA
jgi:chemotaxis-related protein WspD